ncbi:MAG: 5'-3' exonuclease H3TH domain-containing protein [Chloroflexota bacterium]
MKVYLVDGTYELFRYFYAPGQTGSKFGGTRGVLRSVLGMIEGGATHLGVATDRVIESFRNDLYAGYKTGAGIDPALFAQFPVLEKALAAMGVRVWRMTKFEADDALAAAAKEAARYAEQVVICTPDKDLAQCVIGDKIVQLDRRSGKITDEAGVIEKFGVRPESIPDYLALVGDSADGFPGLPGFGAKSAGPLLFRWTHFENIPQSCADWDVSLRGAGVLSATLRAHWKDALLYRRLATLRTNATVRATPEALQWKGPRKSFAKVAAELGDAGLATKANEVAAKVLG